MQSLVKNDEQYPIHDLSEGYVTKLFEFLRIFVGNHFSKFENLQSFPKVEFLSFMFQFTFKQTSCDRFLLTLEIWSLFLDYIIAQKKQRESIKISDFSEKYQEVFISLVTQIICKTQFKLNHAILEELDDTRIDDDSETELQTFLQKCSEVVGKVSEIIPTDVYSIVRSYMEDDLNTYMGLENFIVADNNGNASKLQIYSENDLKRLHYSLKDLMTTLEICARLSVDFTSEHFLERFPVAKSLIQKLIHSISYQNRLKLYNVESLPSVLRDDFTCVHSKHYQTITAYSYWLAQCNSIQSPDFNPLVSGIINNCIQNFLVDASPPNPYAIVQSGIYCFQSITLTARPQICLDLDSVRLLFSKISDSVSRSVDRSDLELREKCLNLPFKKNEEQIICDSICNILLFPWPNKSDSEQDWNKRSVHLNHFVNFLSNPIMDILKNNPESFVNNEEFKMFLKRTLSLFSHLNL